MTKTRRRVVALLAATTLLTGLAAPAAAAPPAGLDPAALQQSLDAVHAAGMPGIYTQVRDGGQTWASASGVADVHTRRPVTANMEHRVGSVTKAFTSAALIQQVAKGRLDLDAPIGRYLPGLVTDDRAKTVTVRMLLDHTSGIGDYIAAAFPSLNQNSGADISRYRFRTLAPTRLARWGLAAPPTQPGAWSYSNTNYVLAGLILREITGMAPERYITENVIDRAGLRHTYFPRSPYIRGPHSRAYENLYGFIDPPKDFSVYDMSWASTAGSLVSTMADLETFYRALLDGKIVSAAGLAEMRKTVPENNGTGGQYGLGIYKLTLPCGDFWGHDGAVWGMGTIVLSSPDGRRQLDAGFNLMKYERLDANGRIEPSKIDDALNAYLLTAACGDRPATRSMPSVFPLRTP